MDAAFANSAVSAARTRFGWWAAPCTDYFSPEDPSTANRTLLRLLRQERSVALHLVPNRKAEHRRSIVLVANLATQKIPTTRSASWATRSGCNRYSRSKSLPHEHRPCPSATIILYMDACAASFQPDCYLDATHHSGLECDLPAGSRARFVSASSLLTSTLPVFSLKVA